MMPSNTVTNTNSTSCKGSDFVDSPGNRMGESTMLGMDLMEEQRLAFSSASFKVGKPGRKRKQFAVVPRYISPHDGFLNYRLASKRFWQTFRRLWRGEGVLRQHCL
ncbi:hypothetical protein ILYODFUR_026599 [Ilyodon furcidens]|uniref:Uncharacterized protein n=1 Tax=Ilyodon furcidens TaxID=33524 RepID=A0ABV0TES8_9TELE